MSYVEHTLSKDEEIREKLKIHWINFVPCYILIVPLGLLVLLITIGLIVSPPANPEDLPGIILFTFFFVGLPFLSVLYKLVSLYFTEMVVTNKRVVLKQGIIATKTEELKNSKIESVEIRQGILDRMFGTGSLHFSGTGTSKVKFKSVDKPWEAKGRVEEYIGD